MDTAVIKSGNTPATLTFCERDAEDKALAETAALLVLRKSYRPCTTGGRGQLTVPDERKRLIDLFTEAVISGARREKAAAEIGLSARTFRRWIDDSGEVQYDRSPEAIRPKPATALSPEERQAIIRVPAMSG